MLICHSGSNGSAFYLCRATSLGLSHIPRWCTCASIKEQSSCTVIPVPCSVSKFSMQLRYVAFNILYIFAKKLLFNSWTTRNHKNLILSTQHGYRSNSSKFFNWSRKVNVDKSPFGLLEIFTSKILSNCSFELQRSLVLLEMDTC